MMPRRPAVLAVLMTGLVALAGPRASAQELIAPQIRDLLHEELSGELAKETVIDITRHHRIQGSRGYRAAAEEMLLKLRAFGFSEDQAWMESFLSDGHAIYQTWQSPSGWDIESAELRMVEPHAERIVGYPEIAMSVITYSNAGSLEAELVWVGSGLRDADYEGRDVAGKFVLATGYGGAVHRQAVLKHGAAAVVCYLDDRRAMQHPDMLAYTGMWPRSDELEHTSFGFNLSHRQGEKLRKLLAGGTRVVLHGEVRGTGLESYYMDVLVAEIRGSERPEDIIYLSAHLDHPKESANDNASGSAAILDIARSLRRLIDAGKLEAPKVTLRFLWVPEWYGTMAYLDSHEDLLGPQAGGRVLANLNLDMVGEDLELLHSKLILTRTPASVPSALEDVVEEMAKAVDRLDVRTPRGGQSAFNWRVTPYQGGSDHMMFLDRKVPAVMFTHSPDYTHHTSEDTPDKVDPVQLERCAWIAAASAWYLANLDFHQAQDLVSLVGANAAQRLMLSERKGRRWITSSASEHVLEALSDAEMLVERNWREARAAIHSVKSFYPDERLDKTLELAANGLLPLRDQIKQQLFHVELRGLADHGAAPESRMESASFATLDARIPERLTRGPLDFSLPESALPEERAAWYRSAHFPLDGAMRFELVNFIDGRNSVSEIRNLLTAEFQPLPQTAVARYLEDLVSAGVVRWKENKEEDS